MRRLIFEARRAPATVLLTGINIFVFVLMVAHGVSPLVPRSRDLLAYGAQQPELVVNGEGWRLLTAGFVHVGVIHLFFNMWCLWNLGMLGEPLLGPFGLAGLYVLTAVAGNLLSTYINLNAGVNVIGAGASGAVFGIAGALIVLLSNKNLPIPWAELKRVRGKVIQFAILNLAIGAASYFLSSSIRIDNMAHAGGLFSGLLLAGFLFTAMTQGRRKYLRRQILIFAFAALGLLAGYFFVARPSV